MADPKRDPDTYFAEHGFVVRVEERNLEAVLPRDAVTRDCTHWADLVSGRSGQVLAHNYGSGMSDAEARKSALARWRMEQGD